MDASLLTPDKSSGDNLSSLFDVLSS
jgi:hypothetical protein